MLMEFYEFLVFIKDFIVAMAAIFGTFIAKKGLDTWRRQLKGQSEYELSRRILVTLFKYRDAINSVRNPLFYGFEISYPTESESKSMTPDEIDFYGVSKAYQARWDKVYDEKKILYVDLLESEAIWGGRLKDIFKNIYDLENELRLTFTLYLNSINPKTEIKDKELYSSYLKSSKNIMYEFPGNNHDEFKKNMTSAIDTVEVYLKPKLTHEEENYSVVKFCKKVWVDVSKRLMFNNSIK